MSAVPDEAVAAFIAAATHHGAAPITASLDAIRAGLTAAAPLLAAQVVRDHAKDLERRVNSAARDGLSFEGIEAIGTVQRLNRLADDLRGGS